MSNLTIARLHEWCIPCIKLEQQLSRHRSNVSIVVDGRDGASLVGSIPVFISSFLCLLGIWFEMDLILGVPGRNGCHGLKRGVAILGTPGCMDDGVALEHCQGHQCL